MKANDILVKSVDFFNEKDLVLKSWDFETPVLLDSHDFQKITPIEDYAWCRITNEEDSEILLDYSEVPYTYNN